MSDPDTLLIRISRPDEVREAAARAVPAGVADWRVREALAELLQNAIEHGNLGFTGNDKRQLMATGGWDAALAERLADPVLAGRTAMLVRVRCQSGWHFALHDGGAGFDPQRHLGADPHEDDAPCGRGLRVAQALLGVPVLALQDGAGVQFLLPEA